MACKFSCFLSFTGSLKENDVGVFESADGDVYRVKYKSNVCRDLLMTIEWTIQKQILLAVKLYNTTFKRCFSSKGIVVNGKKINMKLRGAFNVSNSRNYKVLCVINLIPYINFNEELSPHSFDSGFLESEFKQLPIDENIGESKCSKREDIMKYAKNISENAHEVIVPKEDEIAQSFKEKKIELECSKSNKGCSEIALPDDMRMPGSIMFVSETATSGEVNKVKIETKLSVDKSEKIPCDQNDKTLRNNNDCETFESDSSRGKQFFEKRETTTSKNRSMKKKKSSSSSESEKQLNEFESSSVTKNELSKVPQKKSQEPFFITKTLTLDDYSQELTEEINSAQICNDSKSNVYFPENNLPMEVDNPDTVPALNDENNLLVSCDSKVNEVSSKADAHEVNILENSTVYGLSVKENNSYLHDADKERISSEDMDVNLDESNDCTKNDNKSQENNLTNLSKDNASTSSQVPYTSKICNEKCSENSESILTCIQKSSEAVLKTAKNEIDGCKSKSSNLLISKTRLIFQTVARKLSTSDCDVDLTDIKGEENDTGNKVKKLPETKNNKAFPIMESELKGLSMDMLDLLASGDMTDAVISNGRKNINVHRNIVSARSSIIKKIFVKDGESDTKYHALINVPSSIFEDVIIFLYVGLVFIKSKKMAQDMYEVAVKYNINDLVDICSKHMKK